MAAFRNVFALVVVALVVVVEVDVVAFPVLFPLPTVELVLEGIQLLDFVIPTEAGMVIVGQPYVDDHSLLLLNHVVVRVYPYRELFLLVLLELR